MLEAVYFGMFLMFCLLVYIVYRLKSKEDRVDDRGIESKLAEDLSIYSIVDPKYDTMIIMSTADKQDIITEVRKQLNLEIEIERMDKVACEVYFFQKRSQSNLDRIEPPIMKKIRKCVLENLENEFYNVELLARDMGMSRSKLHRDVKNKLCVNSSTVLNNIKLEEAYKLIKGTDLSVSEIAFATGYNNPSYFIKLFKKKYERTPNSLRHKETVL